MIETVCVDKYWNECRLQSKNGLLQHTQIGIVTCNIISYRRGASTPPVKNCVYNYMTSYNSFYTSYNLAIYYITSFRMTILSSTSFILYVTS